jgi:serine/threonine-protein kinase RsbW
VDLSLTLCLPRDAVSVPLARRVASQLLLSVGFLGDDVADVGVALTEACSNVLRHSEVGTEYEVRLQIEQDRVVIAVQDMGSGPPRGPVDVAEEDAESGRGIPLMRALVDDLSFHIADGGSVVRMERRLRPEPGSAAAAVLLGPSVTGRDSSAPN